MSPAVDAALGAGYRLFDTAKYYYNEAELGAALEVLSFRFFLKNAECRSIKVCLEACRSTFRSTI